jgi:hypothetical protein
MAQSGGGVSDFLIAALRTLPRWWQGPIGGGSARGVADLWGSGSVQNDVEEGRGKIQFEKPANKVCCCGGGCLQKFAFVGPI